MSSMRSPSVAAAGGDASFRAAEVSGLGTSSFGFGGGHPKSTVDDGRWRELFPLQNAPFLIDCQGSLHRPEGGGQRCETEFVKLIQSLTASMRCMYLRLRCLLIPKWRVKPKEIVNIIHFNN